MAKLNYHHLYYFWQVAKSGNLTNTAKNLHISQSALSSQIKQLESTMDTELFSREGRKLVLTESGQHTLLYAEEIFSKGEELESFLLKGVGAEIPLIRIGMLSTMSRNFMESIIEPLIVRTDVTYSIHARQQTNLLNDLTSHQVDLALTNIEVQGNDQQIWQCRLLASQPVSIIGPVGLKLGNKFSDEYKALRWVLPTSESPIRAAFDGFCAQHQFQPEIEGEADDMPMLRLLARDSGALAVMPGVVVKDELSSGKLVNYLTFPNIHENFYAVTIKRHFPNPLINELLATFHE